MVKLRRRRISKRTVDSLSVEGKDAVFWDSELQGFGVRVYPSGSKVYIVQTRSAGRSRRFTLGRHGVISADEARHMAAHTIARVKQGEEPELAPSGWAADPASAPYRTSTRDAPDSTLHGKILSTIVHRYDRPLMSDDHRQEYVVCLIAELLAPDWTPPWRRGYDRAPWDLEHVSGTRMQIKQSAVRAPWDAGRGALSRSSWFGISPLDEYWTADGSLTVARGRLAEIHVFAWHGEETESVADHRAPKQWTFFVIPTRSLRANQRSIGLLDLEKLTEAVDYEALTDAVRETLDGL